MVTTSQQLDELLAKLSSRAADWAHTTIPRRLVYLEECLAATWRVSERWVQAACQAKGLGANSYLAGEEWAMGPMITLRNLRLLIRALRAGARPPSNSHRRGPRGQAIVEVFPGDFLERLLWLGITGEVWLQPGKASSQGAGYRARGAGGVTLVLGAGNVSSIAPTDALSKLFVENQTVLLKLNPVNEYLGPLLEEAFYPLVRDGYLAFLYGGPEIGREACEHAQVGAVHITGSQATYDAIVWEDKAAGKRRLTKPVTAELGCVSPVLVVPGPWTPGELAYQARHLAGMLGTNAGFNCTAPQVLLTSAEWRHREAFLAQLREALRSLPSRKAYYPGAEARQQAFLERYPQAEVLGSPWTFISGVDDYACQHEAFCGVLTEVALPASGAASFLAQAVTFANERLWGNLSCTILIHPETQRNEERALATALEELRYGCLGVNLWPGLGFSLMSLPWGAYPGNTPEDAQSGVGWVHNTNLFDHPEKSVLRGPFTTAYTPPWFPGHPRLRQIGRQLTEYELAPSFAKAMAVSVEVLRAGLLRLPKEPLRLPAPRA